MGSYLDLVEMGLMSNPTPMTVQERIDELKDHRRALAAIKAEIAKSAEPLFRAELEEKVAKKLQITPEAVWYAVGDLLVGGVLRVYNGREPGDIIRAG